MDVDNASWEIPFPTFAGILTVTLRPLVSWIYILCKCSICHQSLGTTIEAPDLFCPKTCCVASLEVAHIQVSCLITLAEGFHLTRYQTLVYLSQTQTFDHNPVYPAIPTPKAVQKQVVLKACAMRSRDFQPFPRRLSQRMWEREMLPALLPQPCRKTISVDNGIDSGCHGSQTPGPELRETASPHYSRILALQPACLQCLAIPSLHRLSTVPQIFDSPRLGNSSMKKSCCQPLQRLKYTHDLVWSTFPKTLVVCLLLEILLLGLPQCPHSEQKSIILVEPARAWCCEPRCRMAKNIRQESLMARPYFASGRAGWQDAKKNFIISTNVYMLGPLVQAATPVLLLQV